MELLEMSPVSMRSGSEKLAALDAVNRDITARQVERLEILADMDETELAQEVGARDTSELAAVRGRVNRWDVRRDLKLAHDLAKYPAVKAALPSPYPATDDSDLDDSDLDDSDLDDSDLDDSEPRPRRRRAASGRVEPGAGRRDRQRSQQGS